MANKIKQILELFYQQEIFQGLPVVPMLTYFQSIIDNDQLITIERDGKIIAFCDYWIINEKVREGLSKLNLLGMAMIFNKGSYPHVEGGKHLFVPFLVTNGGNKNVIFQLRKKMVEKNPDVKSLSGHRFFKDGKFKVYLRR